MNDGQQTNQNPQQPGGLITPGLSVPSEPAVDNQPAPQVLPPSQPAATNPNSTQNSLLISEVRDGVVIMNDGTFRAVVMCRAINFDLMSSTERESVEFAYQGFLNSLYFPIQIFIRSQKVDLRPYLEKLDKIRTQQPNMLLGLLMEDYIDYLASISSQTNIMDKKFYVVIQYPDLNQDVRSALKQSTGFFHGVGELIKPKQEKVVTIDEAQLEKSKTELRNRVQAVMQGLLECGIQSVPLDTQELIELYYDAYNPDTATRQQMKSFNDLTAPVITKGGSPAAAAPAAGGSA